MKSMFARKHSKQMAVAAVGVALVGGLPAVALPRAAAQDEGYGGRIALARDLVKLGIVVMANQTPISAEEARAVLPALEAVQSADTITEAKAVELQKRLDQALSPALRDAVTKVRLPELRPEARQVVIARLERMGIGNPVRVGPGRPAYGRLVEFFRQTAAAAE